MVFGLFMNAPTCRRHSRRNCNSIIFAVVYRFIPTTVVVRGTVSVLSTATLFLVLTRYLLQNGHLLYSLTTCKSVLTRFVRLSHSHLLFLAVRCKTGSVCDSPHHEVATEVCNAVSDFVERVEAERSLLKQPV